MNLFDIATQYRKAGFDVIPVNIEKKHPEEDGWQSRQYTIGEMKEKLAKGCGISFRNHEVIDIDNNGTPNAQEMYTEWMAMIAKVYPELTTTLLVETTPHGGYHISWGCEVIEGNQKLAERLPLTSELKAEPKLKSVVLIETRGIGGQFLVSPTPGYTRIQGDWMSLRNITSEQRDFLMDTARSFNKIPKMYAQKVFGELSRPGDIYNEKDGVTEALELLLQEGWTKVDSRDSIRLCRPGKQNATSATYGFIAPGVFHCFTASGSPFEPNKAYTPFQVFALLRHKGNFTEAAQELAKRYNMTAQHIPEKVVATPMAPPARPLSLQEIARRRNEDRKLEVGAPKTGYPELDTLVKGFLPKHFWTITGETNAGKTMLASNLIDHVRRQNRKALYVALEPEYMIADYLASIRLQKPFKTLTKEDVVSQDSCIDVLTLAEVPTYQELIRSLQNSSRYDVVVIDHIGYFCRSTNEGSFLSEQAKTIRDLVAIAKELSTCVIAIAHPRKPSSRESTRILSLYDISGTAAFAQDSTEVLSLYRPMFNESDPLCVEQSNEGILMIQKTKSGMNGSFKLHFIQDTAVIQSNMTPTYFYSKPVPVFHDDPQTTKELENSLAQGELKGTHD